MKKYKRGRTKRGGYYLWADENDNEWVGTKLKNRAFSFIPSSFVPSFPNLNPLSYFGKDPVIADAPVAVEPAVEPAVEADYAPAADYAASPADAAAVKPEVGKLDYPLDGAEAGDTMDSPMNVDAEAGAMGSPMKVDAADDATGSPMNVDAPAAEVGAAEQAGGRRRRRRRTTKKRKRSNKRKRTMKRRRSIRRRR